MQTRRPANDSPDDFAALFEEMADPQALTPGETVQAIIVSISADTVFLDLGGKAEGVVPRSELEDSEGVLQHAIGDSLEARIVGASDKDGTIRVSVAALKDLRDDAVLAQALATQTPVEGIVESVNKGGYEVRIGDRRAFCPMSQMDSKFTEDPQIFVGQRHTFLVLENDERARQLVVSRAALQRMQREELLANAASSLKPGEQVQGTVSRLADFGAFVDLGGFEGLIPMRELSWSRVESAGDAVTVGSGVTVKILEVDLERQRVSLSLREASANPWEHPGVQVGDRLSGSVTRIADFGAFVEIRPGIEGLVHISEMRAEHRVRHPSDLLKTGDTIDIVIQDVQIAERRISLGMLAPGANPWTEIGTTHPIGSRVRSKIARHAPFGVFVELGRGLTGLLPHTELERSDAVRTAYPVGATPVVSITAIDITHRRILVSRLAAMGKDGKELPPTVSRAAGTASSGESMGTFGDLLKGKLSDLDLKD
jgi:small subunit ribosomal protein S1